MIVRSFFSTNKVLKFALEEIFFQMKEDVFLNDFDFIIFALSPKYGSNDVNVDIKKIFRTENFLAFNAIHSFSNTELVEGVSAVFFKFENKAKIDLFVAKSCCDGLEEYLNKNKNSLNIIISTYDIEIIKNLQKIVLNSNTLIGGIVSGETVDGEYVGNLYVNRETIKKGFVVLSFKNVEFTTSIVTGYMPIGPEMKIRLNRENRVYLIEYEDASLIMKRLLRGLDDIKDLWNAPLLIKRDNLYIPRTIKDIKENLYAEYFGDFENEDIVRISFANNDILLEADREKAKEVKRNLKNCEVIFDFSCIARQYILKEKAKDELEIFIEQINAPLFGFFTFGEIKNIKENVVLFNQTSLIAGVREC